LLTSDTAITKFVPRTGLWGAATATAAASLFFPKIEGIRNHGRSPWQLLYFFVPLDLEGLILVPLLIALTFGLFRLVGQPALRATAGHNRPARAGLVCGLLGIVAVVLFWLSLPIILGGLAITLGLQGRHLADAEGRGREASAAIISGTSAVALGAIMWAFIT
jgi:hypothetical protein